MRCGSPGLLAVATSLALCLATSGDARAAKLLEIDVADVAGTTEVRLRLDGPAPEVESSRLPGRLVLDLPGVAGDLRSPRVIGGGPCLTRVRTGAHAGFLRVVLDLARDCPAERRVDGETIVISLATPPGFAAAEAPEPTARGGRRSAGVLLRSAGTPEPSEAADESEDEDSEAAEDASEPATRATPGPAPDGTLLAASGIAASGSEELETEEAPPAADESEEDAPTPVPAPPAAEPSEPEQPAEPVEPEEPEEAPEAEEPPPQEPAARKAPPTSTPLREDAASTDETSLGLSPAVPPLPVRSRPTPGPSDREGALVSIEFEKTDVRTVLDLIARAGGHRVIFRPEVKGRVSVKALDRPWRDVFADVLKKSRLQSVEHEDLLLVEPLGTR